MRRLGLRDTRLNLGSRFRQILYKDLIEFKDVFPESVPCELPKNKGTRKAQTGLEVLCHEAVATES